MSSTPHCITAADISTAAEILAGHALRTPVMTSQQADNIAVQQFSLRLYLRTDRLVPGGR